MTVSKEEGERITRIVRALLNGRGRWRVTVKSFEAPNDTYKAELNNIKPYHWTATIYVNDGITYEVSKRRTKGECVLAVVNQLKQHFNITEGTDETMSKFKDLTGSTNPGGRPQQYQQASEAGLTAKDLLSMVVEPHVNEAIDKAREDMDKRAAEAVEEVIANSKTQVQTAVDKIIADLNAPSTVHIKREFEEEAKPELCHYKFDVLSGCVRAGINPMLVGPAGSGKTTAAKQIADSLGLPFYFSGAMSGLHQLNGFKDANGVYHETQAYKAFKDGGVLLLDELDAGHPEVLVGTNMMSENGMHDFPVGRIDKHENFILIAAANTFGRGADRMYVGRNQLDAATLDRFAVIDWDYDEKMERLLANNDDLVNEVHRMRRGVEKAKIRHVISPRASIYGAKLIKYGNFTIPQVMDMVVFKGLAPEQVKKIKENAA